MSTSDLPWLEWWQAFATEAQIGTLDLGRYRAQYFSWGKGPVLLCVHGLADSFLAFFPLAALLKSHFRVIAYNLPDGYRDKARLSEYSLVELAQDVPRVLHQLDIEQVTVVGHSYGSAVALLASYWFAQRIARAVTINGFAHRPLRPWQAKLLRLARLISPRWSCPTPYHADLRQALRNARSSKRSQAQGLTSESRVSAPLAPYPSRRWPRVAFRAWVHWASELAKTDLRPILTYITHPTLVIATQHDPLVPETCQQELLTKLPHAIGFRVQASGHFPNWTHPHLVAYAIMEFCRMTSLSVPSRLLDDNVKVTKRATWNGSPAAACPLAQLLSERHRIPTSVTSGGVANT